MPRKESTRGRGRPELTLGDLVVGTLIQAMENDQSRDALSDRAALKASGLFTVGPPAAYTLRRSMIREDVRDALRDIIREIARNVQPLEKWYVIDATYFKTPYYEKIAQVRDTDGDLVWKKIKNSKVYIVRGLDTGIPVLAMVTDENVNDQSVFPAIFKQLMTQGATISGGGILGDAGFNKQEHFELVARYGGRAYFDFDSGSKTSNGAFPHYDEMFALYKNKETHDQWRSGYNMRELIESTNHALKTLFKRTFRCRKEMSREIECLALIAVFAISRFPWIRLEHKIGLPFLDEATLSMIDHAIAPQRQRKTEHQDPSDLYLDEWAMSAFPWMEVLA